MSTKKPKINIIIKGPSRKQIIIPMTDLNAEFIINSANQKIININRCLKEIKSDISANFTQRVNNGITIITNKPTAVSDLKVIEKSLKSNNKINSDSVESPCLPKSKPYLKITGLPYILEQSNSPITSDIIESVIKEIHIFNNIILISKSHIIKASPKSDIVVIWVDIWNSQNGTIAKSIINQHFNIRQYIATIHGMNMNSRVPQCKNCWKWGHATLSC